MEDAQEAKGIIAKMPGNLGKGMVIFIFGTPVAVLSFSWITF